MKRIYIAPVMEIDETELNQMIALSIQYDENGNPIKADDSEVLTGEDQDWNIWGEKDEEDF